MTTTTVARGSGWVAAAAVAAMLVACDGGKNEVRGGGDSSGRSGNANGVNSADGVGGGGSGAAGTPVTHPAKGRSGIECNEGYSCYAPEGADVVWVMKEDGNVNGPNCQAVCENALEQNAAYHACDEGRAVEHPDPGSFAELANGLGFTCRKGGCWDSEAPGEGMYMVSIETAADGSKSCYFPTEKTLGCDQDVGNANCFGERYAMVCPCVPKPLDDACTYKCPPHNTTKATWTGAGTSCLERINYWRQRACAEGWVECPPAGLPPMVECTACHECANSQAEYDADNGAHASFTRCGESAQGEGAGKTCADVIDSFVSERGPDANGVVRCTGHCGPIVAPGCRSFFWGKDRDSGFHTLNWGGCNADACQNHCDDHPNECSRVETSPSAACGG
jgi:hypothetical protein